MKRTLIALLYAGVTLFYSCTDKEKPDTEAPSIEITTPEPSATVWGSINVQANIIDDKSIQSIEMFIDGTSIKTFTTGTINENVDTKSLEDGTHTLKIVAIDASNNKKEETVEFEVMNYFFKFTVADNFIEREDKETLIYYITNEAGDLLGLQEMKNGEVAKFETPANFSLDQSFVLNRLFHEGTETGSAYNTINTTAGVKAGSYALTRTVFSSTSPGEAYVNVANLNGTLFNNISGKNLWGSYYQTFSDYSQFVLSLAKDDGQIFMNLNNDGTQRPRYALLEDVDRNETFNLDYANMPQMDETRFTLDDNVTAVSTTTYGLTTAGDYANAITTGYFYSTWFYDAAVNEAIYHTADEVFKEYIFYTYAYENFDSYSHIVKGIEAPSTFKKLDAGVDAYSYTNEQIHLETSGIIDLRMVSGNNVKWDEGQYAFWGVSLEKASGDIKLVVPEQLRTTYQVPAPADFNFTDVWLIDYDAFETYREYVDWLLGPPSNFHDVVDEYKSRSVTVTPNGRVSPASPDDAKKLHENMKKQIERQF
jgi:hypothetical protein